MKKLLLVTVLVTLAAFNLDAQIITAGHRAGFGVDGEVLAGKLVNATFSGKSSHDWFAEKSTYGALTGLNVQIIDTNGAKYITNRYITDLNFRRMPFFRTMSFDQMEIKDGKLLIDAVFIRDYHGIDSTVFAMSNKNGDNPSKWTGATESNVPDKNDILDGFVHVRRDGSSDGTGLDPASPLWFIGGIALDATNGNRYFDFEMYQTDIFYSRQTQKFTGFGPQDGHTEWKFDLATGRVTTPGDVIFTAEFGGSGLQSLEARIWVHRNARLINSPNFDWGTEFDGPGGNYGYANIKPKTAGDFYTGLQNTAETWAGPFQLVRANNTVQDKFSANQFLEFSVNMTFLGLDPISLLGGGDICGLPFRRILIKTRSSSSFSAELKDFIGPFDFFTFNPAQAAADIPFICGESISTITVTNAMPTSLYVWSTPDGNIISGITGPEITVDAPGTYIVKQQLLSGCGEFASDTVVVVPSNSCNILPANRLKLTGKLEGQEAKLDFEVTANENVSYYVLERSVDGENFEQQKIINSSNKLGTVSYLINDNISTAPGQKVYYRVKLVRVDNSVRYSPEVALKRVGYEGEIRILPNPVNDRMQLAIANSKNEMAVIKIFNAVGALMDLRKVSLQKGNNVINYEGLNKWGSGTYPITVEVGGQLFNRKMIIVRKR
jgi:hypothetical protein